MTIEQARFEAAMVAAGADAPERSQHGGYMFAQDALAWLAWNAAIAAEREACVRNEVAVLSVTFGQLESGDVAGALKIVRRRIDELLALRR